MNFIQKTTILLTISLTCITVYLLHQYYQLFTQSFLHYFHLTLDVEVEEQIPLNVIKISN